MSGLERTVLRMVNEHPRTAWTPRAVATTWWEHGIIVRSTTIRRVLARLAREGMVRRAGRGYYRSLRGTRA